MKKLLYGILVSGLLFTSCGKNDDDDDVVSRRDVLIAGKWKITAGTVSVTNYPLPGTDIPSLLDSCNKDDLSIFRGDQQFIVDAGSVKCAPSDPQQDDRGTWALTDNETRLTFPLPADLGGNLSCSIDQLDYTTLRLSGTGSRDIGGTVYNYNLKITYTNTP